MRIAVVSISFDSAQLATSYRAIKFVKYMLRAGHRIDIISSTDISSELLRVGDSQPRIFKIPFQATRNSFSSKLVNRLLVWPDPSRVWVDKVVGEIEPQFRTDPPDAILVTTPPHSVQIIGGELSKRCGIPYIADLRDDWLTNSRHRWHTPFHRLVAGRFERRMVELCSYVTLNTDIVRMRFENRYPDLAQKICTLPSGYDEEDFSQANSGPTKSVTGKMTLLYAGGSYGGFITTRLSSLARAMKLKGLDKTWQIVTAGPDICPPCEHSDIWTHLGMLSTVEVTRAMCQANLLLLVMPPGESQPSGTVPLKTYQYLRSGTAVVYIGEAGSTTELLELFDGTFAFGREQWPNLAEWLATESGKFKNCFPRSRVEAYSFKALTEKMLTIIQKSIVEKNLHEA